MYVYIHTHTRSQRCEYAGLWVPMYVVTCVQYVHAKSMRFHTASYLPLCTFLAFFTPGISVLESAQRQQPAHHKCKERQAKKKKKDSVWDRPRARKLFKDRLAPAAAKLHFHAGKKNNKK